MSPYRTPARLPRRRPWVHLARVVLNAAGESWWSLLFPSPYEWRWIRRAGLLAERARLLGQLAAVDEALREMGDG